MDQTTLFKVPSYPSPSGEALRSKHSDSFPDSLDPHSPISAAKHQSFTKKSYNPASIPVDLLDSMSTDLPPVPSVAGSSIHENDSGFHPRTPRSSSPSIMAYKRSSWHLNGATNGNGLSNNIPVLAPPNAPFVMGSPGSSNMGPPPCRSPSPRLTGSPTNSRFSAQSSIQGGVPKLVVPDSDPTDVDNDTSQSQPQSQNDASPFNFQSSTYATSSPKHSNASQRRGHRYKHSSVSMNFFQEPPPRAPLPIPKSLPIPTVTECYQSMSREQKIRLAWCGIHFLVAYLVYNCDMPFTALSALAHLLLYDAVSATLSVAVDVLCNFDVWKQSSIHHPFGLERIEVLAGYALVVSLVFMGADIMSHSLQDMIQSLYANPGEHIHSHGKSLHNHANSDAVDYHDSISWVSMVYRVILGIIVTLVSAVALDNHSRLSLTLVRANSLLDLDVDPHKFGTNGGSNGGILSATLGKFTGNSMSSFLMTSLSNPSNLMTVTFSVAILFFPLLGPSGYRFVDTLLTPMISASMCYMGWNLAKALAGMLIMSYPGDDHIADISRTISQRNAFVESVSDVSLWQVHHDLWLASMKIVMSGTDDDEQTLRRQACDIVKQYMDDGSGTVWQTTIDITRTTLNN